MRSKTQFLSLALSLGLLLALSGTASAQWFSGHYSSGGSSFGISVGGCAPSYSHSYPVYSYPTYAPTYYAPTYYAPTYCAPSYPVYSPCAPTYGYRSYSHYSRRCGY